MTVVVNNKKIHVTAGKMRLVILVHEKNGNKFLWPVLKKHRSANDSEGLLGEWKVIVYV